MFYFLYPLHFSRLSNFRFIFYQNFNTGFHYDITIFETNGVNGGSLKTDKAFTWNSKEDFPYIIKRVHYINVHSISLTIARLSIEDNLA